jgi:AcrR family transcriptional regulator
LAATDKRLAIADKRQAILRAAISVFARGGYFNSKVADIAREAGVADGTVYLYFKNKDDILVSIFNDHMNEALANGRKSLAQIDDPIEKIRRIVLAHNSREDVDERSRLPGRERTPHRNRFVPFDVFDQTIHVARTPLRKMSSTWSAIGASL